MAIVVGLDVHRAQITYDALNTATGEVATGRIAPADRATLRTFLRRWAGEDVEAAVDATTGWRFVVEELQRAGAEVQLAEPADTTAARGPKRRAKTDKRDARHLRDLAARAAAAAGVDRTRTHPRAARPGAAAQDARRPAHRVAATHPRRALSPRGPARRRPARRPRRPRAARRAGALAGRAAPDHGRAGRHRARQLAAGTARPRPQGVRARPARLPGA
jgi:hypothetical protein